MLTAELIAIAQHEANRVYDGEINSLDARLIFTGIARSGWHGEPYNALMTEFDAQLDRRIDADMATWS